MKIDLSKMKVVDTISDYKSEETPKERKHAAAEYKRSIKELRKELRYRGLAYTGTKEELLDRLKKDDTRIQESQADSQLESLEKLKARVQICLDYEVAAAKEWSAAKERWDAAVARKYKVLEEKELAVKAYEGFREVLRMQGYDISDFD
tara:strand:- start:49 stop:495 length:447 start_codon:yes stop_codon:yes gene_type:complete